MNRVAIDGCSLEFEDSGVGEPVVCIHGAFIADAFRPLFAQRDLASRYRLISYHRRGYIGSSRAGDTASLTGEASDCRSLLAHLGVRRAHVVGHSFGGAIGLQLALDAPGLVHTLSLLEAALMVGKSADMYRQGLMQSMQRYQETGANVAVDEALRMRWPAYRERLEQLLPGALEHAATDAATSFERDLPAALDSRFGRAQARRIAQPVLVVLGARSIDLHPRFDETHRLLLDWLPNAEGYVVPDATHFLQMEDPQAISGALIDFFARHPLGEAASV